MTEPFVARWTALTPDEQARWHGVGLCIALFLFHYTAYSTWFVEDAAITFAYARNLAVGEGLVGYPGAPRVEGFSNPTWTLLLAFLRTLGVSPFMGAKLLGAALGAATLPVAYAWARRLAPQGLGAVAAPLVLATSPQFVCWAASGLENPLFCFLLAVGSLQLLREIEGAPGAWSAIPWMLLACTRPEAPLYVAVAGVVGAVFVLRARGAGAGARQILAWGLVLGVPFVAWFAWRYQFFAWTFPNTYYAKLGEQDPFVLTDWDARGWKYVRSYALTSTLGFLFPILFLGQTGLRGWRGWLGIGMAVAWCALLAPGLWWPQQLPGVPEWTEPETWVATRLALLVVLVVLLPGIGLDRRVDTPRVLAWFLTGAVVFFAVFSSDWMDGYRWFNLCSVPLSVLVADAVTLLWTRLSEVGVPRLGRAIGGTALAAPVVAGLVTSGQLVIKPETGPFDVARRVLYMQTWQQRLGLDHVTLVDVDMGAHMWWSGFDIVDMAGLIDVPIAHHEWQVDFMDDYVYGERRPEFAHVHGSWGSRTNIRIPAGWKEYVEVDAYPVGPKFQHVGNHVHRRVLAGPAWPGPADRVVSFGAFHLAGWDVPAPEVTPGGALYLDLGWQRTTLTAGFRAVVFLAQGGAVGAAWEVAPAYDQVPVQKWKTDEVFFGRHALPLPEGLPLGSYDLGFLVMEEGREARVMAPTATPGAAQTHAPAMAAGEVRWPRAISVAARPEAVARADAALDAAVARAAADDCAAAEQGWQTARRHLGPADRWQRDARRRVSPPLARCWARQATEADDTAILRARRWDHRDREVLAVAARLADRWEADGDAAWAAGDTRSAEQAWLRAVHADPSRAWVRRRVEQARDARLQPSDPEAPDRTVIVLPERAIVSLGAVFLLLGLVQGARMLRRTR